MRIKQLDVLRFIAVMLVLARHGGIVPVFSRIGWVGVDLFFVLSGFLISGLLYSEFKRRGALSLRRFFIRRGLKIYPAFFVMILVTFVARRIIASPTPLGPFLHEIFFIQNYRLGVWQHTWSLGVEEHFYIFLPIFFLALFRFSRDRENPFRSVPWVFGLIAVLCLLLRFATIQFTAPISFIPPMVLNPTHERMDSLFFGVVLGYLYHFHPSVIGKLFNSTAKRIAVGLLTMALLACSFLSLESHFLLTFGLSFLYLGFGGLLLMSIQIRDILPSRLADPVKILGTASAFVGTYSYSIYLWHIPFRAFAPGVLRRLFHIRFDSLGQFWFYLTGSILFGILMATLIEFPVLKLRDRLFPPRTILPNGVTVGQELATVTTTISRQS
jgi:peptidoglycan/LPS O-acetylase OafA/YrhL